MLNTLFAIILIAHGLVHAGLAAAPIPNDPDPKPSAFFTAVERSWQLPKLSLNASAIHWIGIILVVLATLGFVLAGLGGLGVRGSNAVWRSLAVFSACLSLLLILFWQHGWW